ncbi:unnamed protein product, partial [Effrenium voratum]
TTGGSGWARGAGAHLQRAIPLQRRGKEVINRQPMASKAGYKVLLEEWDIQIKEGKCAVGVWLSEKLQKRADEGNSTRKTLVASG